MTDSDIPIKTSAGSGEIKSRSGALAPRLRTVLIMADGMINAGQLRRAAATLGAPGDCLEVLLQRGLIMRAASAEAAAAAEASATPAAPPTAVMTTAERFLATQKFMNDSVVDAIGLRAFFFTLKLERCFTVADLQALLPAFARLVAKGSGEAAARVLAARAHDMMK